VNADIQIFRDPRRLPAPSVAGRVYLGIVAPPWQRLL